MSGFLWSAGHIGWGLFTAVAFTAVWLLIFDLVWRLRNTRVLGLVTAATLGWGASVALIVLGYWLAV